MLYVGLIVGLMLGGCISVILLVVVKELVIRSRADKVPGEVLQDRAT
jgi:uncharacterized protein YceK